MSALGLAWEQFRFERKLFWRNPSAAFFNFLLPLLLLFLVASVFSADPDQLEVIVPGVAAMSVMATTFNALAFNLTFLREQGILKRVRGTPIPAGSYLGGLLGSAVANAFVQVGLVVAIGHFVYGVDLPREPLALVGVTALGVACFGAVGVAFSHAIPNFDSAPAYANAVFLPLIFISGVFYSADSLPAAVKAIAEVLPLKHAVDLLSTTIVTGGPLSAGALAVLAAWTAAGSYAAVRFFRWS
ncbi:MAG: ABC transporter permease [Thermoleophilaceae bacterium]|nr:ABC transporter permease [Thermoleophilaceae bacterium]